MTKEHCTQTQYEALWREVSKKSRGGNKLAKVDKDALRNLLMDHSQLIDKPRTS